MLSVEPAKPSQPVGEAGRAVCLDPLYEKIFCLEKKAASEFMSVGGSRTVLLPAGDRSGSSLSLRTYTPDDRRPFFPVPRNTLFSPSLPHAHSGTFIITL